jgi:soluble lytic murein transglycosylase
MTLAQPKLGPGMATLSSALREHLTGQAMDDPARRAQLGHFADEFIEFTRLHEGSPRRQQLIEKCDLQIEPNPFCRLIVDPDLDVPAGLAVRQNGRHARVRVAARDLSRIKKALASGNIAELNSYPQAPLLIAFKKMPKNQSVQAAMQAALDAQQCPSTALLTTLGLRAERGFPDPAQKEMAIRLFSRSMACGDDLSTVQAGYRLGLIQIWNGNWKEADRILKIVTETTLTQDYQQRALYWRYYAQKQLKDPVAAKELQARLLREYPLSLHALFTGDHLTQVESQILNPVDPAVAFRSNASSNLSGVAPAVNDALAMAELLQERGDDQGASDVLSSYADELKAAEDPVQLYGTVLLMRSGEVLRKFKWMASLFHNNPGLISPPTLEMLYPLRRFDLMRLYEAKVDPYLLISLIRQESAFNEHARSGVGALGLMQVMPSTARRLERGVSRRALLDPSVNVRLGVRVFKSLLNVYNGDVELALAAYNAGKDRVDEWRKRYPTDNRLLFIDMMPFQETREYVASIARNYYWYLRLYDVAAFKDRMGGPRSPAAGVSPAPAVSPVPGFMVFSQ